MECAILDSPYRLCSWIFAFAIQSGTRKVKDSEAVAQNRPFISILMFVPACFILAGCHVRYISEKEIIYC